MSDLKTTDCGTVCNAMHVHSFTGATEISQRLAAFRFSLSFPFLRPEEKQKLAKVVKYLHSTEDGESREETHGASNKAKLTFQGDFLVTFNLVVSCRVKVNQNVLELHNSIQRMRT